MRRALLAPTAGSIGNSRLSSARPENDPLYALRRLIAEPLFQFLVIGALLFVGYSMIEEDDPARCQALAQMSSSESYARIKWLLVVLMTPTLARANAVRVGPQSQCAR
ncbi:MAG: hypothetical protein GY798_10065 [Hyphomicrobiales bacterium]|nr:hypothetical protein [Hyphomicrobiales bacterium]